MRRSIIFSVFIMILAFSFSPALANWTEMDSGTSADLSQVWGTSYDNVFAAGLTGEIFHFDGSTWSNSHTVNVNPPWVAFYFTNSMWGSSPSDVYAPGNYYDGAHSAKGAIFHYDGSSWQEIELIPKKIDMCRLSTCTFVKDV